MSTGQVNHHVRSFYKVLAAYDGSIPLARFLTQYFRANKQMGSKDRKMVSRYLYHFFRVGHAFSDYSAALNSLKALPEEEKLKRLLVGEFLCATESVLVTQHLPEFATHLNSPLDKKISIVCEAFNFNLTGVFPWHDQRSESLDSMEFFTQYFVQPLLYIRVRKSFVNKVVNILKKNDISFELDGQTLSFPNGTSLEKFPELKGLYEVQDYSSQQSLADIQVQKGESWWDACSGAGGKSLLLLDEYPNIHLTVSDVRPSILENLKQRFKEAGITHYNAEVVDLLKEQAPKFTNKQFDGILLDVPCTGSGTWGRTPEMLSIFNPDQIQKFSRIQKDIAKQALTYLKAGKRLHYITCSVFKEENERVVAYLKDQHGVKVISTRYHIGYDRKADTLFSAILEKPE